MEMRKNPSLIVSYDTYLQILKETDLKKYNALMRHKENYEKIPEEVHEQYHKEIQEYLKNRPFPELSKNCFKFEKKTWMKYYKNRGIDFVSTIKMDNEWMKPRETKSLWEIINAGFD